MGGFKSGRNRLRLRGLECHAEELGLHRGWVSGASTDRPVSPLRASTSIAHGLFPEPLSPTGAPKEQISQSSKE